METQPKIKRRILNMCRICLIFASGYVLGVSTVVVANSYNHVILIQIVPSALHLTEELTKEFIEE